MEVEGPHPSEAAAAAHGQPKPVGRGRTSDARCAMGARTRTYVRPRLAVQPTTRTREGPCSVVGNGHTRRDPPPSESRDPASAGCPRSDLCRTGDYRLPWARIQCEYGIERPASRPGLAEFVDGASGLLCCCI